MQAFFLCLLLLFCTGGCVLQPAQEGTGEVREFTDSLGRTVEIPAELKRVAVSGPIAQGFVAALAPDRLLGLAEEYADEEFLPEALRSLPVLGQLYGGKGELNPESLLSMGAEIVIDMGESKAGSAADLDALQAKTGIPFVHIRASLSGCGKSFRLLGELLGLQKEAEELALYCEGVYQRGLAIAEQAEKRRILYITGIEGLNVIPRGSYHSELIDLLGENCAVLDAPSDKGTGNGVDLEQIYLFDPEIIFFAPESTFDSLREREEWALLGAVKEGNCYQVPGFPENWLGSPPGVQRLMGMMWMEKILYPELADYDLCGEIAEAFLRFYHTDLSRDQIALLLERANPAR